MPDSPASSDRCQHQALIDSLNRQSAAMERLADLLPQLVALNQMLLERVTPDDEERSTYLDGSPR